MIDMDYSASSFANSMRRSYSSVLFIVSLLPSFCIKAAAAFHPTCIRPFFPTTMTTQLIDKHKWVHREDRGVLFLSSQKDFFDFEEDEYEDDEREYGRPNKNNRQQFTNTQVYGNNPVEDEFRNMRYEVEEDDYEDTSFQFSSNNNLKSKRSSYDETRRPRIDRDTFYIDEDDVIDVDDDEEDEDESRLFERGGGNFWSNPKGSFDTIPPNNRLKNQSFREERSSPSTNRGLKTRTRVRTGTSPPSILKDFYDRLFWYGFDPDETTTAADKTVFGGTKGKFNGLALLKDAESDSFNRGRQIRQSRGMKRDLYEDTRGKRNRRRQVVESDNDDEYDYEEYTLLDEDPSSYNEQTMDIDDRRRIVDPSSASDEKNQASEGRPTLSPLNRDIRDTDAASLRRQMRNRVITKKKTVESMIPKRSRQLTLAKKQSTISIFGIMDKVFQIDDSDISTRAADYDQNINLSSKNLKSRDRNSSPSMRRNGYAYPYEQPNTDLIDEQGDAAVDSERETVIDVGASTTDPGAVDSKDTSSKETQGEVNRQKWIDRADADEMVPPKEVIAWGPSGLVDGGISARKHAANIAKEEINCVKRELQTKEQKVIDAEEDLILVKAEASMQRKRLIQNLSEERLDRLRRRLWSLNEEVEESARMFRKARAEAKKVSAKLAALENRHWALLSQVDADETMFKDDKI